MSRPLRKDQAKLGQVASQCVDQLRALSNEALVSSECHGARLVLGALHGDAVHVRTQHGFSDRRRICRVVLLSLDERLHIDGWDQSDIVAAALCHTTPVVAGGAGFHRNDARFLGSQHLHQLRTGNCAVE